MSITNKNPGSFGFPIGTLIRDAQLLLEALQDGTVGSPIVVKMHPTYVADLTAQIALVAKLGSDKSGAVGSISSLTSSQTAAVVDLKRRSAVARRAAKYAFAGQDILLRSEFQVGLTSPANFATVLERGRNLLAACQKYATELAPRHWSADDTAQLSAAIDALVDVDASHEATTGEKMGVTEQRLDAARRLLELCVSAQFRARLVYPARKGGTEPPVAEARKRFLLDVFPPRRNAIVAGAPVTPTVPVTVTPAHPSMPVAVASTVEAGRPVHRLEAAA